MCVCVCLFHDAIFYLLFVLLLLFFFFLLLPSISALFDVLLTLVLWLLWAISPHYYFIVFRIQCHHMLNRKVNKTRILFAFALLLCLRMPKWKTWRAHWHYTKNTNHCHIFHKKKHFISMHSVVMLVHRRSWFVFSVVHGGGSGHRQLFVLDKQYLQFNRRKRNIFALYDVIAICHFEGVCGTDAEQVHLFLPIVYFSTSWQWWRIANTKTNKKKVKERPNIHYEIWKTQRPQYTTYRNLSMFHQWK